MARAIGPNVSCFINTDKDGVPVGSVLWEYTIEDGNAKKTGSYTDPSPDFGKTFHSTGAVGEFWRDGIDAIKAAEGIA